ncbi:hypothetical protein MHYP_G00095000 [Metynnis hypsauchen]
MSVSAAEGMTHMQDFSQTLTKVNPCTPCPCVPPRPADLQEHRMTVTLSRKQAVLPFIYAAFIFGICVSFFCVFSGCLFR